MSASTSAMTGTAVAHISRALRSRLEREARGDAAAFERLVCEALARRWLASEGMPSWRNASPPGARGRYGILVPGWRRLAVARAARPGWTPDQVLSAACDILLLMETDEDMESGRPAGFLTWSDLRALCDPEREVDPVATGLRSPGELKEFLPPPRRRRLSLLKGTLRLLLAGDPEPLEPLGCEGRGLPARTAT